MVLDHYLIVKEWTPDFHPMVDKTEKLIVWARFPGLPVEYYNLDFLLKIGEKIGKPIRIDEATSLVSRGKFASMCIEVDITKPLLAHYKLRWSIRRVEYEGIYLVCFKCEVYGHRQEQCGPSTEEMGVAGEQAEKATGGKDGVLKP